MGRARLLLFVFSLATLAAGACNCDEDPLTPAVPGTCEPTFDCPDGFQYRRGECRPGRCQIDSDCCPGQSCNAAAGFCADQFISCTTDEDCTEVPGQTCVDFREGTFCGYPNRGNALTENGTQICQSNADCDNGRSCFGDRCVIFAPCEGGCPDGQVCDVDSNTCFTLDTCTEMCGTGQMLVLKDPDTQSGPACCLVECECAVLPPVLPGQFGWYASLQPVREGLAVASFDPGYGDLVVTRFDSEGRRTTIEYVDGFPLDGPVVANPEGPRGGRDQAGPVVGEHASMAVDAGGVLHVAYYDRDEGRLKYATDSGGLWKTSIVDEDGNSGLYTSIAIGPDGNPHISYLMAEGTVTPDPMPRSALKYASARTQSPATPGDWSIQIVDSKLIPPMVCDGGCAGGTACIDLGMGPSCIPAITGCAGCMSGEACVDVGGTPTCEETVTVLPIDDLIEGTGLFSSLAFTSTGTALIAFYDRVDGDLKLATSNTAGAFSVLTLEGNDMMEPTDVGQHVSLAVGPADLVGLAYFDATKDDLVYRQLGANALREVVDNGVTPPDLRLVGADASLIFDASGNPAVAYQDPTNTDLLYARRMGNPGIWSTEVLRGAPPAGQEKGLASGFYASQKRVDSKAFIANVDVSFDPEGNLLLDLLIVVKEIF
jgi:hypothetical protein